MNPKRLLQHFNEIADAPDAVPRLRRFILDLAVRGKLVEQDSNDEPAVELLKRIGQEKRRLVKEGIRKEKLLPPVKEEPIPFQIPRIWQWSRLAEVGFVNPRNSADDELPASFVPMPLISAEYGVPNRHEIRPWGEIKNGYTHFADGDVALAKITPCFENGKSAVFRGLTGGIGAGTTELHVLRPVIINPDYALVFLKCPHFIENGIARMTGTAGQKRVPTEYFACSPFPLPPLPEQHRIVAKVDEMMALCDELEAAQQKQERRRDRLVAATLNGLNNGEGGSGIGEGHEFEESARFYFNHLPRLTTRPEHIQQLRKTILDLAVRGKLVPQHPNDEPAEELLKRIESVKQHLMKKGRIRKQEPPTELSEDEVPFQIPESWKWVRSTEPAVLVSDHGKKVQTKEVLESGKFPVVDQGKVFIRGYCNDFQKVIHVNGPVIVFGDHTRETKLIDFDFVVGADGVKVLKPIGLNPSYYFLSLRWVPLDSRGYGRHFKLLRGSIIPLPPLAEQYRIVAKVDELMAICDELESRLSTTATTRRHLLESTLSEAIAL